MLTRYGVSYFALPCCTGKGLNLLYVHSLVVLLHTVFCFNLFLSFWYLSFPIPFILAHDESIRFLMLWLLKALVEIKLSPARERMTMLKVFGQPAATDVARVLTCLFEKDLQFQIVRIDSFKGEHKVPEFLRLQASHQTAASFTCIWILRLNKGCLLAPPFGLAESMWSSDLQRWRCNSCWYVLDHRSMFAYSNMHGLHSRDNVILFFFCQIQEIFVDTSPRSTKTRETRLFLVLASSRGHRSSSG